MTTLSVPLAPKLENIVNSFVKEGYAPNKAEVVRKALIHLAEEKAIKKSAEQKEREIKEKRVTKSYSRRSTRQNPIVKVLTSATFIRAFFGILKKMIK